MKPTFPSLFGLIVAMGLDCTTAIPYNQGLRLRRIYSMNEDFKKRAEELKSHLTIRGYEETATDLQINRAASVTREEALRPAQGRRQTSSRVPLVVTFHPGLTRLNTILKKHQPILHISERLQQAIPDPPLVSFRRPPKLRDLLTRAQLKTPATPINTGNAPCGSRCHRIFGIPKKMVPPYQIS